MRTHAPLDALTTALEAEQDRVTNMVMDGACPDYVSYREMVASYKALQTCIDTARKVFSGDEDEVD
jgi:hypothetical protein